MTRLLTGEIGIGYTQRTYEDPRLEKITGLVGDASLVWTANALTTVKLTGKSSVGESTVPGVSGVLYRDVGLQVDHSFRRWLIGSLKLGFGRRRLCRHAIAEDKRYSAGLGLDLQAQPHAADQGRIPPGLAALQRHRQRL